MFTALMLAVCQYDTEVIRAPVEYDVSVVRAEKVAPPVVQPVDEPPESDPLDDLKQYPEAFELDAHGHIIPTSDKHLTEHHQVDPAQLKFLSQTEKNRLHGKLHKGDKPGVAAKPVRSRILFFTAKWCTHCVEPKRDYEWLRKKGWRIDKSEQANLQVVDVDERPDLRTKYAVKSLPHFVLIRDGVKVDDSKYTGRQVYADLYKKLPKEAFE